MSCMYGFQFAKYQYNHLIIITLFTLLTGHWFDFLEKDINKVELMSCRLSIHLIIFFLPLMEYQVYNENTCCRCFNEKKN